jgi:hypothetical protein
MSLPKNRGELLNQKSPRSFENQWAFLRSVISLADEELGRERVSVKRGVGVIFWVINAMFLIAFWAVNTLAVD